MYQSLDDQALLATLEQSGKTPHPDLIAECLARQESLTPALLELLQDSLDDDWEDDKDPRWHRQRHAGKLLIAFREPAALPIFADLFTRSDDELDVLEWFETDLAHYGATAVSTLLHIVNLDTAGDYHYGRALACGTLSVVGRQNPETREEIVSALRVMLPPLRADGSPDVPPGFVDYNWTSVLITLGELADSTSQPQIEAVFKHDLVDESMIDLDGYYELLAGEHLDELSPLDVMQEYQKSYEYEQNQQSVTARAQLLREQGFRPPVLPETPIQSSAADWYNEKVVGQPAKTPKIGRNDPCPCGSGLKYKKCHGRSGMPPLP